MFQEKTEKHNLNSQQSYNYSCRILIAAGSLPGKKNVSLHLTNYKPDIDKIYLYAQNMKQNIKRQKCWFKALQ